MAALAVIHVDDILVTSGEADRKEFMRVMNRFKHSGLIQLAKNQPLTYLGLDLILADGAVRLSQKEFDRLKVYDVELSSVIRDQCFCIDLDRRRTIARQVVGNLLRMTQTRSDANRAITALATTAVQSISDMRESLAIGYPLVMLWFVVSRPKMFF